MADDAPAAQRAERAFALIRISVQATERMTSQHEPSRTGDTSLMPYWDRVARRYATTDPLAAVCYPAAPPWFNRFYARFQLRAVERMLADVPLAGMRALDVGCGGGRWSRWLRERGATVVAIDPTPSMLETAARLSPGVEFHRMSATAIDLPAASFDLVMSVTVIQHLRPEEQERAAAAMVRVLRPGGRLFVLDLIDRRDPGRLVFARTPAEWIALYERLGMTLERWSGQEYIPLIRALTALIPSQRGSDTEVTATTVIEDAGSRRLMFTALWPVIQLSYPIELLCERLMPSRWGRHACFLFRKRADAPS